jgi:hypothetical protein
MIFNKNEREAQMVSAELLIQPKLKRIAGEDIRIRIPAHLMERVDMLAAQREMTRAETVRYIIGVGLDAVAGDA